MNTFIRFAVTAACVHPLLIASHQAHAQTPSSDTPGAPGASDTSDASGASGASAVVSDDDTTLTFSLGGGYIHQFTADLDEAGDFDVDRLTAGLNIRADLNPDTRLTFQFNYGLDSYDFSGGALNVANPWNDIHSIGFGVALTYDFTDSFSGFAGPVFQFAREEGADWDESFTGGGIFGGSYKFSDSLTLGGGLAVITQIEDDARFVPIIIVNWKISDSLHLRSRGGSGSGGRADISFTGVELVYSGAKNWEFALGGANDFNRFRLDEDGDVPNGVGEDEMYPLWVRATWDINADFNVSAVGGVMLDGQLELNDSGGDRLEENDYDPAPFLGLFGSVRF